MSEMEVGIKEDVTGSDADGSNPDESGGAGNAGGMVGSNGWDGLLSTMVVAAVNSGGHEKEFSLITMKVSLWSDEFRSTVGSLDYAVLGKAQSGDGADDDVILLPQAVSVLRQVVDKLSEIGSMIDTLRSEVGNLRSDAEGAGADAKYQEEVKDAYSDEIEELKLQCETGQTELEAMQSKVAAQEGEILRRDADAQEVEKTRLFDAEQLEAEITASGKLISEMTEKYTASQADLQAVQLKLVAQKFDVEEAQSKLKEKRSELAEAKSALAVGLREGAELGVDLARAERELLDMNRKFGKAHMDMVAMEEAVHDVALAEATGLALEKEEHIVKLKAKAKESRRSSASANSIGRVNWVGESLTAYSEEGGDVVVRMAKPRKESDGIPTKKWGSQAVLLVERVGLPGDCEALRPTIIIGLLTAEGEASFLSTQRAKNENLVFGVGLGNLRKNIEVADESADPSFQVLVESYKQDMVTTAELQRTVTSAWQKVDRVGFAVEASDEKVNELGREVARVNSRVGETHSFATSVDARLDEWPDFSHQTEENALALVRLNQVVERLQTELKLVKQVVVTSTAVVAEAGYSGGVPRAGAGSTAVYADRVEREGNGFSPPPPFSAAGGGRAHDGGKAALQEYPHMAQNSSPVQNRRDTMNPTEYAGFTVAGGAVNSGVQESPAVGGVRGSLKADEGVQGGSVLGSPSGRSKPFSGSRTHDSGGEFGPVTPAGYGSGGSCGSAPGGVGATGYSVAEMEDYISRNGPQLPAGVRYLAGAGGCGAGLPSEAADMEDYASRNGPQLPATGAFPGAGGFGAGLPPAGLAAGYGGVNASMVMSAANSADEKQRNEAMEKSKTLPDQLEMVRWGCDCSARDMLAVQGVLSQTYEPADYGRERAHAKDVMFYDFLDSGMLKKYSNRSLGATAEDLVRMQRTTKKFKQIVADCLGQEKFQRTGKTKELKHYVVGVFERVFSESLVHMQEGNDTVKDQEASLELFSSTGCHYGQTLGAAYDCIAATTQICIDNKCPTFINGAESDVDQGLVSRATYEQYGPAWPGKAKGQQRYLDNLVPVALRNLIGPAGKKLAARAELTVDAAIKLMAELPHTASLGSHMLTEDTNWNSPDVVGVADNAQIREQLKDENAYNHYRNRARSEARARVNRKLVGGWANVMGLTASQPPADQAGGQAGGQGGTAGVGGKAGGVPKEKKTAHVTKDFDGKPGDPTRCLIPGHAWHSLLKCNLTVDPSRTYNLVGCAPTTGQVVSEEVHQTAVDELTTYEQRTVVRNRFGDDKRQYVAVAKAVHREMLDGVSGPGTAQVATLTAGELAMRESLQRQSDQVKAQQAQQLLNLKQAQVHGGVQPHHALPAQAMMSYMHAKGFTSGKGMMDHAKGKGLMHPAFGKGKGGPASVAGSASAGVGGVQANQQMVPFSAGTYADPQYWAPPGPPTSYGVPHDPSWGWAPMMAAGYPQAPPSSWAPASSAGDFSEAPEVELVGGGVGGSDGSTKAVVPVAVVGDESMVTFSLSPQESLFLGGESVLDDETVLGCALDGVQALVGATVGVQAAKLLPLFRMDNVKIGQSWIVPVELYMVTADGSTVFKTIFVKVDTGAELSGVTMEGAEMMQQYQCKPSVVGSPSYVRGIGHKTVPVTKAIFPTVCFQEDGTAKRRRQTLQVLVMEGATDRTHQILLGLDNIVALGGVPHYVDNRVVGIRWTGINCYSELCTPASAARQFAW
jgi:hypothetical protein